MMIELRSSVDLPGSTAMVWFEGGGQYRGIVAPPRASWLVIKARPDEKIATSSSAFIEVALPDGLYRFPAHMYQRDEEGLCFVWPAPEDIVHSQRRQFFRESVDMAGTITTDSMEVPVRLCNLSGGGARLRAAGVSLPEDTQVELSFRLRSRPLTVRAAVLRHSGAADEFAVRFVELPQEAQDRIVGFTFWAQAKRRGRKRSRPARVRE